MKKVWYFIPFILGCVFYGLIIIIDGISNINPFVWLALLMLFTCGILLKNKKWWGSFLGILIGILLIYMGNKETGQIFSESPFGILMCIYYLICSIVCLNMSK